MNIYIIVEGKKTEPIVYPQWLSHLAPFLTKVDYPDDMKDDNYYLFSACGIPVIYDHIAHAIEDIISINSKGVTHIDYLMVCIDTEEESKEYIHNRIAEKLSEENIIIDKSFKMLVFEQKVSMESWFLGNRRLFKSNPESHLLRNYINHYNVKTNDPEEMDNIDTDKFSTKAQFHHSYLREIFKERNIKYTKNNPGEVCENHYLQRLIERYTETGHIASFGKWYDFISKISQDYNDKETT